jgi:hypothetical protein
MRVAGHDSLVTEGLYVVDDLLIASSDSNVVDFIAQKYALNYVLQHRLAKNIRQRFIWKSSTREASGY